MPTPTESNGSPDPNGSTDRIEADHVTDADIADVAARLRIVSVEETDRAGSGHPTSSMSAADLIAVLIARHLRIDTQHPDSLGNDRMVFSKGHASPLLYGALDTIGVFDATNLNVVEDYRQPDSILEGHPTPLIPGVQVATGSLGLGIAMAVGMTISHRSLDDSDAHVWVLCGDGELAEGSIWEAIEHAGSAKMAGLTVVVDVNRLGQTGQTRHEWDVEAYDRRFSAFAWETMTVDGHDIAQISRAFDKARAASGPTAVIARTRKGAGATETDNADDKHGMPLDDAKRAIVELGGDRHVRIAPRLPTRLRSAPDRGTDCLDLPTWEVGDHVATRDAFGQALTALGRSDPSLVALDADVGNSTRLELFAEEHPERFFQMYIAEQLMIGAAIGLCASGWTPVVSTFGAFLTRAHDVIRMATVSRSDLAIVGSHAGVSIGEDGPSQMALEDLAMMRCLDGSTVLSTCDANQTAALLPQLVGTPGVSYLRTMRASTPVIYPAATTFRIGGSAIAHGAESPDVTLVATGVTVHEAIEASHRLANLEIAAEVLDLYSIKPIDAGAIIGAASRTGRLVVIEDHRPEGGLGEAVANVALTDDRRVELIHLAVSAIPRGGSPERQRAAAGIDAEAITKAVIRLAAGNQ